ncbi:MAG TPA: hypothetical protein VMK83_09670 [Gaiellaceae bacterium]|nr:hypothetical protein [Gaiellaceae bacterium]
MLDDAVPLSYTEWRLVERGDGRERAFLDALGRVTSYSLNGASLTLLANGEVVARFRCWLRNRRAP